MTTTDSTTDNTTHTIEDLTTAPTSSGWRVVDIVIAAVLGVAVGLIFWAWNYLGGSLFATLDALTPGVGGLAVGIWLLGGVLGGLIIRKPGAAVLVETIAAVISALIGNQWGWTTVRSGFFQGLGAELIFLIVLFAQSKRAAALGGPKAWRLPLAMAAGALAGFGAWANELVFTENRAKSAAFNAIYLGCTMVSGIVLAGVVGWLLTKALAGTGALNRFAAGRQQRELV